MDSGGGVKDTRASLSIGVAVPPPLSLLYVSLEKKLTRILEGLIQTFYRKCVQSNTGLDCGRCCEVPPGSSLPSAYRRREVTHSASHPLPAVAKTQ
jgi:hypothetical protein